MKSLVNKGRRRLGIAGRPAIVLGPNESTPIDDKQLALIRRNRTVERWLQSGVLVVTEAGNESELPTVEFKPKPTRRPTGIRRPSRKNDDRKIEELPEGITGEGVEFHHVGGGWWQVFVNGIKATDRNVRKDEAEQIAVDYEPDS